MTEERTIVVGRKPVRELLDRDAGLVDCVFFRQDLKTAPILELRRLCSSRGVPVKNVPASRLGRLASGANHQGVVASVSAIRLLDLDEMLAAVAPARQDVESLKPLLVLPARVTDPHNLGAIVRSSVAFGSSGILLPDRHTARMDATALKASAGAGLRIPFGRVRNIQNAMRRLKERGYWIAGLSARGDTRLADMDWDRPIVLVVGSESKGLPAQVEEGCDFLVSIPIKTDVESLNASVAAGIALQAASR